MKSNDDCSPPISSDGLLLSSFLRKWSFFFRSSNEMLAQDRIQTALNLADGFKILHKGKVLFPTTFTTRNNERRKGASQQVSDLLMTISAQDESFPSSSSSSSPSSPSLVVMGTLMGRELPHRPIEKKEWKLPCWQQLLQLPWAIVYWSIHSTWVFAQTFLAPVLPRALGGDGTIPRERSNPDAFVDDHRHND